MNLPWLLANRLNGPNLFDDVPPFQGRFRYNAPGVSHLSGSYFCFIYFPEDHVTFMRIAFVSLLSSEELAATGVRTAVRELATGLARRGHEIIIVTSGQPCVHRELGVTILQLGRVEPFARPTDLLRPGFVVRRFLYMARVSIWLRRMKPDLVEVPEAGIESVFLLPARPCPIVARLHGNVSHTMSRSLISRFFDKLEGAVTRCADAIYSPSSAYAELIARDYDLPRAKIAVIPYGIDIAALTDAPSSKEHPDRWALGERHVILFSGTLTERKGAKVLFDTITALRHREDVTVVVAGRIEAGHGIIQLPNAVVTGELTRSDLAILYRRASVFLLPSDFDNLSLSIIEAMSFGLPIVAFNVGGNSELVEDGVNGFLAEINQPQLIPSLVLRVIDNPNLAQKFGEASAKLARRFDISQVAAEVENFFSEVVLATNCKESVP